MSAKHTPGPWAVNPLRRDQICTADGRLEIGRASEQRSLLKTCANARLIAAAPAMYLYIKWRSEEGCLEAAKILRAAEGKA